MAKGNSVRRNSAFDTSKPEFIRPQTRLEANRWLDKVTFGAATALTDIDASTKTNIVSIGNDEAVDLMASTYAQYLEDAFVAEPRYPLMDALAPGSAGNEEFGGRNGFTAVQPFPVAPDGFQRWFIAEGVYGPSRARIKATYALSQMIVCRIGSSFWGDMTTFADTLFQATKSTNSNSFKTMLKKVTFSAAMGRWLTYMSNSKANEATKSRPDENYAREIMQLFSIGLDCLNMDGTPILDVNGDPVPTYPANYVSEAAKFFTGFQSANSAWTSPNAWTDMQHDGFSHETAQKEAIAWPDGSTAVMPAQTYFRFGIENISNPNGYVVTVVDANNFTVPLGTPALGDRPFTYFQGSSVGYRKAGGPLVVSEHAAWVKNSSTLTVRKTGHGLVNGDVVFSKSNVEESLDFFLDRLTNHPTCAPYFAKSMIKLLVTSNPSPQYVRRVAEKFVDNGNGVYGDISAVFKAIFLDRECIVPFGKNPNNHGKYSTMFDRFMRLGNALRNDCVHVYESNSDTLMNRGPVWGSPTRALSASSQAVRAVFAEPRNKEEYSSVAPYRQYTYPFPFNSPSVFNFYRPGYIPPKSILGELALTAPELQVTTPESQTLWSNIVLGATAYHDLTFQIGEGGSVAGVYSSELMDPRGGRGKKAGYNLSAPTTITVTSNGVSTNTAFGPTSFQGTVSLEHAISGASWYAECYHRRLGAYVTLSITRTTATGEQTLTFTTAGQGMTPRPGNVAVSFATDNNLFQIGDVLDAAEFFVLGSTGFNGMTHNGIQPFITLFHKAASMLPDTLAITDGELDAGINYLEGILMTEPISTELRALMKEAANETITLPARMLPTMDATFINHYRYMVYGYSQIRLRRMLAVLLVSPEFCTLQ